MKLLTANVINGIKLGSKNFRNLQRQLALLSIRFQTSPGKRDGRIVYEQTESKGIDGRKRIKNSRIKDTKENERQSPRSKPGIRKTTDMTPSER